MTLWCLQALNSSQLAISLHQDLQSPLSHLHPLYRPGPRIFSASSFVALPPQN